MPLQRAQHASPRRHHRMVDKNSEQEECSGLSLTAQGSVAECQPPKRFPQRSITPTRPDSFLPIPPSLMNPWASTFSPFGMSGPVRSGGTSPTDSVSSAGSTTRLLGGGHRPKRCAVSPARRLVQKNLMSGSGTSSSRSEVTSVLGDYSRYPQSAADGDEKNVPSVQSRSLLGTDSPPNDFREFPTQQELISYARDTFNTDSPFMRGKKGFVLFPNEIEDDDEFHTPKSDDDKRHALTCRECCSTRNTASTLGTILFVSGLLFLFIAIPILTFTTNILSPLSPASRNKLNSTSNKDGDDGPAWAHVNNKKYELLKNVRQGRIDPSTPASEKTRKSAIDGTKLKLVFSDEFNEDGRTFYPGDDPYWTAQDLWYGATMDLEWYDPDAVTTGNGTLQITFDDFFNHGLQYRSGMLNSWNKTCFKGGVMEVSVSLAGPAGVPGLWPGVWTLGNLARPGFLATTDGVWPYSYSSCDIGITPNQSDPSGLSALPGQKLSSCSCPKADHPSPGIGRGAPEIDVLEASVDPANFLGTASQSYQIAPFDVLYTVNSNFMQIPNYNTTSHASYVGGIYQQAISGTTVLNKDWYGGNAYQKYAFEYQPGTSKTGKIIWFVGEEQSWMLDGRAIGKNGNVDQRSISEEPMAMVLNLGMGSSWSTILTGKLKFPTKMYVDYVRIFQREDEENLTCDPEGYPTTKYITKHRKAYENANVTSWKKAGYDWPKNSLTGC